MIKANFSAYGKYVADSLYQWEQNRVLNVTGLNLTVVPEVHFSNSAMRGAIVRQATMEDHVVSVKIPNPLLQHPLTIKAHIGIYEGDLFKVVEEVQIPVIAKARPEDYIFEDTEGEVYSYKRLENMIENINETWYKMNEAQVQATVTTWLDDHPEATTTVQDKSLTLNKFSDDLSLNISTLEFNFTGDGESDNTDALQTLLDRIGQNAVGGVLKINGECVISSPLSYHSNTTITTVSGSIRLISGLTSKGKMMFRPYEAGVENVVIENLTIDHKGDEYGNDGSSPCISVSRTKNVIVRNCTFKNVQTMAVWFDDTAGITENIKILNNTIKNGFAGGFSVFGYVKGLIITGNYIANLYDDAIALQPGTMDASKYPMDVVIADNIIEDCFNQSSGGSTPRGIISYEAVNVTIKGNIIKNTFSCNIAVWCDVEANATKDLNVVVMGNVCENAGFTNTNAKTPANGVRVVGYSETVRNVIVANNTIINSRDNGVYVKGDMLNVNNNTVKTAGQSGIFATVCNDCLFKGNIIENAGVSGTNSVGIFLASTSVRNIVTNNRVYGAATTRGVTLQANATNNQICGNNFKGVSKSAVYDLGSDNDIGSNITQSGYPVQRDFTISANACDFSVTGISATDKGNVLIYPLNSSARALLQQGYWAAVYDEKVDIHTTENAIGTEKIRLKVL